MTNQRPAVVRAARSRWLRISLPCACIAAIAAISPTPATAQPEDIEISRPDETSVELSRFSEPVDLRVLIDYISQALSVNILIDPGLTGQSVAISGPMVIPKSKLFQFLQLILEPNGFVVTYEPELDTYNIRAGAEVPFNLEGQLATTIIIPTPMITPSALQGAIDSAIGTAQTARISYIDELGIILSTGSPRANSQLRLVVSQILDNLAEQTLHPFPLENIAASEVRDRLLSILGGASSTRSNRAPAGGAATNANAAAAGGAGGALSNLESRLIIPSWGNQIIYRGTEQEARKFAEYLAIVDVPSTLVIERYAAGSMVSVITQIGSTQGLGPVNGGASQTTGAAFNAGRAAATGAASTSAAGGSRFVIEDAEEGIFLYYGTPSQHKQVEALIDKYAGQVTPDLVVVEFYKLKHATAPEVADLLSSLLEISTSGTQSDSPFLPPALGSQRGISRLSSQTPGVTQNDEAALAEQRAAAEEAGTATLGSTEGVSITTDEPNNQLIVRATLKQQADIARIIENLDQRRPQVYIEAKIISVSASDDFAITVDTALTSPSSDVPTFTNFGLVTYGDNAVPTGLSGITSALIRNDYIPIIVNAIANNSDGRTESNPHILVNDNEEAQLQSTTNQAFAQTTQTAGNPTTTSVGGSASAGTTLTVQPQISAGGYIKLNYSIELSTFVPGTRSANLPSDTQTNTFDSQVNVPSGSTVVVGGFVQKDTSTSISKVPILGDIPLIGLLFQDRFESEEARIIYVFITPKILRDPTFQDLRLLTTGPRQDVELDIDLPELEPQFITILASDFATPRASIFPPLTPTLTPTVAVKQRDPGPQDAMALSAISPSLERTPDPVRAPDDDPQPADHQRHDRVHAITSQRGSPL
ncbi:MAG: hypothetical protein H6813_04725 [Phycisphaeraceae bacterium]|nr:hypothetical protein [Phycisphaeraceae bacterium]MCB9847254.1 hypothetical protein [Phycisphaeraceae bacterium]